MLSGRSAWGILALTMLSLSCASDQERLPLPPLPRDGAPLSYSEVLSRLSAQTATARDEHFLNHWDVLVEVAQGLEQSVVYLPKATDVPVKHQLSIQKDSTELLQHIRQLQAAAKARDQTQSLELIRRIHNQIRELKID